MIRIDNLTKEYKNHTVFNNLTLTVNDKDVIGVIGASGSGKSLLLRNMILLDRPDSGKIYLDDEEITAPGCNIDSVHKRIGMVFQNFNLFDHMSSIENVMSGLIHLNGMKPTEAYDKAKELLKTVGLADKAFAYPRVLSGGQKQRVAIARTLALEPEIILMDEPTSSLDPIMRGEVETVIRMLAAEGHTMVIATHEMDLLRRVCNRVVFIHDGVIWEDGTPGKILDDADREETRRFVRAIKILEFDVRSSDFDFIGMQTNIMDFAYRNGIKQSITNKLLSITEELVQMIIVQPSKGNVMNITAEYNQDEEQMEMRVQFSGQKLDPDDPMYVFSWPIIQMRADEITIEESENPEYTNKVLIKLK